MNRQNTQKLKNKELAALAEQVKKNQKERDLQRESSEAAERKILILSLISGILFALVEFIAAIYTHSQSVLMDAAYDTSDMLVVLLTLILIHLFNKPMSEKHPYGYLQVESLFVVVKESALLMVSLSLSVRTIEIALSGGNTVDGSAVSLLELGLGIVTVIFYLIMRYLNRFVSSPVIQVEILDWKIDIAYSLGLSFAFFMSTFLYKTPLAFIAPYFDPLVAAGIVILTIPASIRLLWQAIKDVFLFAPEEDILEEIKKISNDVLMPHSFKPIFYDITRTGRHIWVAVYFQAPDDILVMDELRYVNAKFHEEVVSKIENCTTELIVAAGMNNDLPFQLEMADPEEDEETE